MKASDSSTIGITVEGKGKHRNKGGKFINPSDIKKIYGLDENKANKLIPFVWWKTTLRIEGIMS